MPSTAAKAFEAVYADHQALVRRVLLERGVGPADLDDVVQETFVIVHRQLPGFEGRSSIETWLHAIARRVAANHRRKRRPGSDGIETFSDEAEEPSEIAERVFASFSQVEEEHRDLLALHEIGGLSISSLASLTGTARATIRSRLERGQAALTRALAGRAARPARDAWLDVFTARFENPPPPLAAGVLYVLPDGQTCIATHDDIVIAVWRSRSSDAALQSLIEILIAHAHSRPDGIRYFAIVESTSTPPSREGRAMTTWSARKLGPKVKAMATTVEGSPLMSLVAAVMNTCLFLARQPLNMRFFDEVDATLAWLRQCGDIDTLAVKQLIERMRLSLDA